MKYQSSIKQVISVAFLSIFLVACSGTDTKQEEAAAAAAAAAAEAQAAAEAEAAAAQAAQERAAAQAAADLRELQDAARMAGDVVYFEFDSSALTDEGRAVIDAHVALLKGSGASVRLEGHTDERGTREYNIALGERRANTVRDYMMVQGIPGYRLESISYGEEKPVSYGSSEVSWSQNRRVEIK